MGSVVKLTTNQRKPDRQRQWTPDGGDSAEIHHQTNNDGQGTSYVENRAHLLLLCQKVFKFKLEIAVVSQKNGDRAARVFARVVLPGL